MDTNFTLFETSWEVAQKVGGIHTVLATKARRLVERLGDRYVCVGPWTLGDPRRRLPFVEEPGFDGFADSCRALGVPVRVGRWQVPGTPRTVLADASGLNARKDDLFKELWERYRVDSLFGGWDYAEPVLFGLAAATVIERWWQEFVAPRGGEAVAQFHEWMTASGMLRLKSRVPAIGTVFTTHATVLGRALGTGGQTPEAGLAGRTPDTAAEALGVRSKHSMEAAAAREADVLTTVSEITADEVDFFLRRRAKPVLVNGIDLEAVEAMARGATRASVRPALERLASRFLGEDVADAALLAAAGRYEAHNKGYDVVVDALGRVAKEPGRRAVLFLFVPAGNSGVRKEVLDRLAAEGPAAGGPLGRCTHNLFDPDGDALGQACAKAGLDNAPGSRVKVIHVADYLAEDDGLLGLPWEAVLRGLDLTLFPSFYEPWGYTPVESLAAGVPTVSSDLAGFGLWANEVGRGPSDGVTVLPRRHRSDGEAASDLAGVVSRFLADDASVAATPAACRATADLLGWPTALETYENAFKIALARAADRALGPARAFAARTAEPAEGAAPHFVDFEVAAALPEPFRGLLRVSRNLWWCWDQDAPSVFEALSPEAWAACHHNPVAMLADVTAADLSDETKDAALVERVNALVARFDAYVAGAARIPVGDPPPCPEGAPWPDAAPLPDGREAPSAEHPVAYFCAEFGVHESLPVYNGGLGVLAGDHLKAASDLAFPLVGVGLFYRKGYLRQRVSVLGDQIPLPVENEPRDLPMDLVRDAKGRPLTVLLDMPGTRLTLVAWRVMVGRVPLYLLDADLPENRPEDRAITHQLYGGDQEHRLRQEVVLGKGGMRLLHRLGIEPSAIHLNEGHAAFAPLERVSRLVHQAGLTFDEAVEIVRASTAFTTHTPVPAGHDRFPEALLRRYFSDSAAWVGLPWERFLALGQAGAERDFNMTYLGLRVSAVHNGVSRLHGAVSRRLLGPFWPGLLEEEVPVGSVTNGVHLPTWTAAPIQRLLGVADRPVAGGDFAARAEAIDGPALWSARRDARRRMLADVARFLHASCDERHEPADVREKLLAGLSPDALLVGFARRFATYKRADLLLRDLQRFERLVGRTDRPIRIFYAGKAHPHDAAGQDLLRKIVQATRSPALLGKVYFLDDYDMELARRLVQGVDVWLNTPVRGMEASGTSGMKATANGAIHLSVRDGWWDEGFDPANGWAIGEGPGASTREVEDDLDAAALYRLLEEEVAPAFFDRDEHGVPHRWLARVRRSLATLPPVFDARRMVGEYGQVAYLPLASAWLEHATSGWSRAKEMAARHGRVRRAFAGVRVLAARMEGLAGLAAGGTLEVSADVDLAGLAPEDVLVELVFRGTGAGAPRSHVAAVLAPEGDPRGSVRTYRGSAVVKEPGRLSGAVRVRARVDRPGDGGLADLVVWA